MREKEREIKTQANQSKSPETNSLSLLFSLSSVSLGDLVMEKKSLTNEEAHLTVIRGPHLAVRNKTVVY